MNTNLTIAIVRDDEMSTFITWPKQSDTKNIPELVLFHIGMMLDIGERQGAVIENDEVWFWKVQ